MLKTAFMQLLTSEIRKFVGTNMDTKDFGEIKTKVMEGAIRKGWTATRRASTQSATRYRTTWGQATGQATMTTTGGVSQDSGQDLWSVWKGKGTGKGKGKGTECWNFGKTRRIALQCYSKGKGKGKGAQRLGPGPGPKGGIEDDVKGGKKEIAIVPWKMQGVWEVWHSWKQCKTNPSALPFPAIRPLTECEGNEMGNSAATGAMQQDAAQATNWLKQPTDFGGRMSDDGPATHFENMGGW